MAISAVYVSATSFTVTSDLTAVFHAGRRVNCDCGVDGSKYGTILSSVYSSPNATIVLTAGSDDLTSNLASVELGILSTGADGSLPEHNHKDAEGDGGAIAALGAGHNVIINGDFRIAQRQVSFVSVASGVYLLDMWVQYHNSAASLTFTQDTDVPTLAQSGHNSEFSLKMDTVVADAAVAAAAFGYITYIVEGYDFAPIEGGYATLGFWIKSTKTGVMCVSFQNAAVDRTYISEVTINASDTWEFKTITVNFNSGGTFLYTNGVGLYINFGFHLGSDQYSTADTWVSNGLTATPNQENLIDNAANNVLLSQVQLVKGKVVYPYVAKPFAQAFAMCQRYYEHSYDYGVYPGAADTNGEISNLYLAAATLDVDLPVRFKASKRALPTVVAYDEAGTSGTIYKGAAGKTARIAKIGFNGCTIGTADATSARRIAFHYTAAATM